MASVNSTIEICLKASDREMLLAFARQAKELAKLIRQMNKKDKARIAKRRTKR